MWCTIHQAFLAEKMLERVKHAPTPLALPARWAVSNCCIVFIYC